MIATHPATGVVLALLLLTWGPAQSRMGGVAYRAQPPTDSASEQVQVAAFRYFVAKPCALSAPLYSGGCLLSFKRRPVSDRVLERLRDLALVGQSEPGDFESQDGASVAFARKRALLLDIQLISRKTADLVEVEIVRIATAVSGTECTASVKRIPSGEWRLVDDDVRCTL